MKVFGLHGALYRAAALASRLKSPSEAALAWNEVLARWRRARNQGLTAEQAAQAVGISRATLYRWHARLESRSKRPHRTRSPQWSHEIVRTVERLRAEHPMWGKRKLGVLLARTGCTVSVSTVGRILRSLMDRGTVVPVPILRRKPGGRRFRPIGAERHARRLPKGLKPTRPGELVQLDTLFINIAPDRAIKHFTAYDPVAKWTTARVASRATAASASALLDKLIAEAPFPIQGLQVDGGSEFMAEFEQACAARKLRLFVLPPKQPQLNGAVERAQASWRYEFYACHDLPARLDQLQPLVDRFARHFNHVRPHQALGDLTPAEYRRQRSQRDPAASHMS